MPQGMQAVTLVPHPGTPSRAARSIVVHWQRVRQAVSLRYVLAGDLSRVRVPPARPPARTAGLWRHTCFEMFAAEGRFAAYREFNFSPSGEWAAYAFAAYREGGAPLACPPPEIAVSASEETLELRASVACAPAAMLRVGLSAVVEEVDGALSYWALCHSSDKPDFHHAGAFALEIDAIRH